MIYYKTRREIESMRKGAKLLARILRLLSESIIPGKTTPKDLDELAARLLEEAGAIPSFLGYKQGGTAYPAVCCISVNSMVVHGIPTETPLQEGDIVSIDIGACLDGWHADTAWTYPVGTISPEAEKLLNVTRESLYQGIAKAKVGNRVGDISHAVQRYVESQGCSIVRELVGHGIGRNLHEEPSVPNFGRPRTGSLLKEGMTLCIEPMVNVGSQKVKILPDQWTVVTADNSLSAHFEHMVAITRSGPDILSIE
jgi:methionyl aminopeptidase